jgi:hypothetical protein
VKVAPGAALLDGFSQQLLPTSNNILTQTLLDACKLVRNDCLLASVEQYYCMMLGCGHSPACASPVLIAVVFSGGQVRTPSWIAVALPVPMPLHTRDSEVSAWTERAEAICIEKQQKQQRGSGSSWVVWSVHSLVLVYAVCKDAAVGSINTRLVNVKSSFLWFTAEGLRAADFLQVAQAKRA